MAAGRIVLDAAEPRNRGVQPGDTPLLAESLLPAVASVAAVTITAAEIVSGLIYRTGPTAGYADVWDTAANIVSALQGNGFAPDALPGSSFRVRFFSSVAFANTLTYGAGLVAGTGVLTVSASSWRDFLFTLKNTQPLFTASANTTSGSAAVTFFFPSGKGVYQYPGTGNNQNWVTTGATVTGTGIPAGTTVLGVTEGVGGFTGVTLSANATATSVAGGTPLTFGPTISIDSLGSGTL